MRYKGVRRREPLGDEEQLLENEAHPGESPSFVQVIMSSIRHPTYPSKRVIRLSILMCGILSFLLFFNYIIWYFVLANHASDMHFLEMKSCPACLGQSACPYFLRGDIHYDGLYRYPLTHKYNEKNVFTGVMGYLKDRRVYLKKLASDEALQSLDKSLCEEAAMTGNYPCVPRVAIYNQISFKSNSKLELKHVSQLSELTHCPTQRLLDRILAKFRERANPESGTEHYTRHDELILLFNLNLNPHGVLVQTFTHDEGWPFSRYLGSCGRWMMEEYAGEPLLTHWTSSLKIRLQLMHRLLHIADRLSENSAGYNMYLPDVDGREFVVHPQTLSVTLVDTRKLLVVDVEDLKRMHYEGADVPFVAPSYCSNPPPARVPLPSVDSDPAALEPEPQQPCTSSVVKLLTVSRGPSSTLCSHTSADFNIFSMCRFLYASLAVSSKESKSGIPNVLVLSNLTQSEQQEILQCTFSRGWLHDFPTSLEARFPLRKLLCECFLGYFKVSDGEKESHATYQYRIDRVKRLIGLIPQAINALDNSL